MSLDFIYSRMKQYDQDERVREYLSKVENNTIEYIVSGLVMNESES